MLINANACYKLLWLRHFQTDFHYQCNSGDQSHAISFC